MAEFACDNSMILGDFNLVPDLAMDWLKVWVCGSSLFWVSSVGGYLWVDGHVVVETPSYEWLTCATRPLTGRFPAKIWYMRGVRSCRESRTYEYYPGETLIMLHCS